MKSEEKVKSVKRKSMYIVDSGRSSDFISPSFGHGCLYNCAYCYLKRHIPEKKVSVAKNTMDILTAINNHAMFAVVDKPNQTDPEYVTYDISCNEDFALHAKYHEWKKIFTFFKKHTKAKATLATKYVNNELLAFNPEKKVRIRFSLMPQAYSDILEPNTSTILERLKAVERFSGAGYEVHLNFSPVIIADDWEDAYAHLFTQVAFWIPSYLREEVKCEVIFLTHSVGRHEYNLNHGNSAAEKLLFRSDIQEKKTSNNGEQNLRYDKFTKPHAIETFKKMMADYLPWCEIRYIF